VIISGLTPKEKNAKKGRTSPQLVRVVALLLDEELLPCSLGPRSSQNRGQKQMTSEMLNKTRDAGGLRRGKMRREQGKKGAASL